MRTSTVLFLAASMALVAGAQDASAKPKKHHVPQPADDGYVELPLTVNQRSFLDPGPVAPVGTGTNYVAANTIFNKTPDQTYDRSHYGNDVIVGQPYVPGRSVPVAEFATGPNVGDLYTGPILGLTP